MKIDAKINSNRELGVVFDFPENTDQHPHNVWVGRIEIFNTKSYLDGIDVYQHTYDPDIDTDPTTPEDVDFITDFSISEHDINIFEEALHSSLEDVSYQTNLHNDLIVVKVTLGHSAEYLAEVNDCSQVPSIVIVAAYYPCPIYEAALNSMLNCKCDNMCEENLPYKFMYALLKKKAIDSCIESEHYDNACVYYLKFFKDRVGSCGCCNKKIDVKPVSVQHKNCNCHENA